MIAVANAAGALTNANIYDEYGVPSANNSGRFGYTGQAWMANLSLYYYKARFYNPAIGRFMQPDPIGYAAGMNLYAYVGNDPINAVDPWGLSGKAISCDSKTQDCITVTGRKREYRGWSIDKFFKEFNNRHRNMVFGPLQDYLDPNGAVGPPGLPDGDGGDGAEEGGAKNGDGCETPPISAAERAAARRGDRSAFWNLRLTAGDPMAATAVGIVNNNTLLGQLANQRLQSAIVAQYGTMNWMAVTYVTQDIGVEIMQAHVAAVNQFGSPTSEQVAQYHFDIFRAHGLPASTFGGAPLTGSQTEAGLTSGIWMGGC